MRVGSRSRGPKISHLTFTNDLLLFVEASTDQMFLLKIVQNLFVRFLFIRLIVKKTSVCFSKNLPSPEAQAIAQVAGFSVTRKLGRYLGAQISFDRSNINSFKSITEKIQVRLSGWKRQCLSMAGRITLAKSVLGTAASCHMQHDCLPSSICNQIEKAQRSFIWGIVSTPGKPI